MRAGHEQVLDEVVLPDLLPALSVSAAPLARVRVRRDPLDVAHMAHGHAHILFLDDIPEVDVVRELAPGDRQRPVAGRDQERRHLGHRPVGGGHDHGLPHVEHDGDLPRLQHALPAPQHLPPAIRSRRNS